jgi:hypothetical protein
MIPPRTFNGENFGNGVKYRVAACRKRLRVSRTTHRTPIPIQMDEELGELDSFATLAQDGYSANRNSATAELETLPRQNAPLGRCSVFEASSAHEEAEDT